MNSDLPLSPGFSGFDALLIALVETIPVAPSLALVTPNA